MLIDSSGLWIGTKHVSTSKYDHVYFDEHIIVGLMMFGDETMCIEAVSPSEKKILDVNDIESIQDIRLSDVKMFHASRNMLFITDDMLMLITGSTINVARSETFRAHSSLVWESTIHGTFKTLADVPFTIAAAMPTDVSILCVDDDSDDENVNP